MKINVELLNIQMKLFCQHCYYDITSRCYQYERIDGKINLICTLLNIVEHSISKLSKIQEV